MTTPMLINEMKRHAVVVVLQTDHGDLQYARFLRITRLFVHNP